MSPAWPEWPIRSERMFMGIEKDKRAGPKKISQLKESCSEYKGSTEPPANGGNNANQKKGAFIKDYVEAHKWLNLAGSGLTGKGLEIARINMGIMEGKMTSSENRTGVNRGRQTR